MMKTIYAFLKSVPYTQVLKETITDVVSNIYYKMKDIYILKIG